MKKKIDPPKRGEVLLFWNFVQQVFKDTSRDEACDDSDGQQTLSAPPAKAPPAKLTWKIIPPKEKQLKTEARVKSK